MLETRLLVGTEVPLVAELRERLVELLRPLVSVGVREHRDCRPIALLEVLAVVERALKGGYLEHAAFQRGEGDAVAEQVLEMVLCAP